MQLQERFTSKSSTIILMATKLVKAYEDLPPQLRKTKNAKDIEEPARP